MWDLAQYDKLDDRRGWRSRFVDGDDRARVSVVGHQRRWVVELNKRK